MQTLIFVSALLLFVSKTEAQTKDTRVHLPDAPIPKVELPIAPSPRPAAGCRIFRFSCHHRHTWENNVNYNPQVQFRSQRVVDKKEAQEDGIRGSGWWVFPVGATVFNAIMAEQQYRKDCPTGTLFDGEDCR
jgi:hypothetical protein